MTLAVALAIAFQASQAPVTYTGPAARAEVIVPQLGEKAGTKLAVSASMANEVLLLQVKDLPLDKVMARIAQVTSGKFIEENGGFRLVADDERRRSEARAELTAKTQEIRTMIAKKLKEQSDQRLRAAQKNAEIGAPSEEETATLKLLQMVAPEDIAAIPEGGRLVYSSLATPMQKPFRGNAAVVVQSWLTEHNKQVAAMGPRGNDAEEYEKATGQPMPDYVKRMMEAQSRPFKGNIGKVHLVIRSQPFFGGLMAEAVVYDSAGGAGLDSAVTLESGGMAQLMEEARARAEGKKKPADTGETAIAFSSETKKLIAMTSQGGEMFKLDRKFDPVLLGLLSRPDQRDPLSFLVGEALSKWAEAKGKPLVACIPDSAYPSGLRFLEGAKSSWETLQGVEKTVRSGESMVVLDESDVLTLAPKSPVQSRLKRVNRLSLATLTSLAASGQTIGLDTLAAYAVKNPEPRDTPVAQGYLTVLSPTTLNSGFGGEASWQGLRIYAHLSPAQRQALSSGGRINVAGLLPEAQRALHLLVFGSDAQIEVTKPGEAPAPNDPITKAITMFGRGGAKDLASEPTEALPNGLTGSVALTATSNAEPMLQLGSSGGPGIGLGMLEMATIRIVRDFIPAEQRAEAEEAMKLPETARRGVRRTWNFRAEIRPQASVSWSLQDDQLASGAGIVSTSNLPSDIQAALTAKIAELKKSPLGAIGAMGGMMGGSGIKP